MERQQRLTSGAAGWDCIESDPDHFGYLGGRPVAAAFGPNQLAATMIPSVGETLQSMASWRPRSYIQPAKL